MKFALLKQSRWQVLLIVGGLIICGLLVTGWKPTLAGTRLESAGAFFQYLPIIRTPDCVPRPIIPPNDLQRDLAVEALINDIREGEGLPLLENSKKITQAVLRHSNDMANNNFVDTFGSDGSNPGQRLDEACYKWGSYGEVIVAGPRTPSAAVEAWMASTEYRDILLNAKYDEFGAGYAYNGSSQYKHYWTVDFGMPADSVVGTNTDLHLCSYTVEVEGGELWISLNKTGPCVPDPGSVMGDEPGE